MRENIYKNNIWMKHTLPIFTFFALGLSFGAGKSQAIYRNDEPVDYSNNYPAYRDQTSEPDYSYLDKLYDVDVSKKDGVHGKEFFPLLMPKIHPPTEESYLCTPIEIKDNEFYITGNSKFLLLPIHQPSV